MGRFSSGASPLAAVLVLLLVGFSCCCAAAARPLLPAVPLAVHAENGFKDDDSADGGPVLQEGAAGIAGDELSVSEMVGTEEAAEACEEGKDGDECLQRRLLRDAHLDYIYTQHKGKP